MRYFIITNNLLKGSFAKKLNQLILLISTFLLTILFIFFYIYNTNFLTNNRKSDLGSLANILSDNSQAALTFEDQNSAQESLSTLRYKPYLLAGGLYLKNGKLLESWGDVALLDKTKKLPDSKYKAYDQKLVYIKKNVVKDKDILGKLVIVGSTSDISNAILKFTITTLVVFCCCLFISLAISTLFQKSIKQALVNLSITANQIAKNKDYTKRVNLNTWDEFQDFINSFNLMLQEIQIKDETLEEKVRLRTEDLLHAKNEAEAASKAKSQFLANMSHEIRTPLNGVLGMIDSLIQTQVNENQKDLLLTADFSGKLLLQIVNDILDFSKIQEGKLELNSTPEDLYSFIDKLAKVSEEKLNKKEIAFVAHIQPGTPRYLHFDTYRVRQILLNLLDNAVKFTAPEGGIMLLIEHEEFDHNKAKINFHIIDSGIGIDHNKISEIFKPFTQEDSSTTRKFGGTGLGLTICTQLAELMQGSIKVRSKKMIGSVFTFDAILNICDIEKVKEFSIESKASIPLKKCPFNILLAEDNLINQKVVKNILEKLEAKLLVANNGQEVIELLDRNQVDLILMDIQMPILDGLEATALIRNSNQETRKQIPIIALTAHALIEEKEKYLAAGMNDYVTKPVDKFKLVDAIHSVLELDK